MIELRNVKKEYFKDSDPAARGQREEKGRNCKGRRQDFG